MITAGIDAGMETTKVVILNGESDPEWVIIPGGTETTVRLAQRTLDQAAEKANISVKEISYIIATGVGREFLSFVNEELPEFQCLATGIYSLLPSTRILLDLGARKSLAVKCNGGRTVKVATSSKCASGTGTYLEMVSTILDVDFQKMTELALQSKKDLKIQSTCAIFAESEIISLVHDGAKPEDIIRGVFRGISGRIYPHLLELGIEKDVSVVGGVAKSKVMIAALEEIVGSEILVPENPEIVGALGAALIAREKGSKI
ncbi:acyl-CoA dehydratase activase [Thermodesulfobacteriota bacterium]